MRHSTGSRVINGLVAGYLDNVSPGISKQFKKLHSCPTVTISLVEVVAHFSKTAAPKRKLAIKDGPDTKKTKTTTKNTKKKATRMAENVRKDI